MAPKGNFPREEKPAEEKKDKEEKAKSLAQHKDDEKGESLDDAKYKH